MRTSARRGQPGESPSGQYLLCFAANGEGIDRREITVVQATGLGYDESGSLADWLPELLRGYGLGSATRVRLLRSYTNDVYLVEDAADEGGRYILKLYGPVWRSEAEVRWEIALLDHLVARHAPVARVVPRRNGERLTCLPTPAGTWVAVLFEHAPGHKPMCALTPALYRTLGQATARLHRASDDFTGPSGRRPRDLALLLDEPMELILRHIDDPETRLFLRGIGAACRQRLEDLPVADCDSGVCHGDVSLDNVHLSADGQFVFYDFDSGGYGWRAEEFTAVAETRQRSAEHLWEAYLDGYTEIRGLSDLDRAAVACFVPVTQIWGLSVELTRQVLPRGPAATRAHLRERLADLRLWAA